jgi:retinol dehydrogenase 12
MACPHEITKDGYESQWQTNFLAPHALTMALMPLLKSTAAQYHRDTGRVRIVNVSSDAAFLMGPKSINYADPNLTDMTGALSPWRRYGHCKQASIISTKAINDRYSGQGVTAYSLHPGIIKTNLQSNYPGMVGKLARVSMAITPTSTVQDGARTTLYCATSLEAAKHSGHFFVPFGKLDDHRAKRWIEDPEAVDKLWDLASKQLSTHGFNTLV